LPLAVSEQLLVNVEPALAVKSPVVVIEPLLVAVFVVLSFMLPLMVMVPLLVKVAPLLMLKSPLLVKVPSLSKIPFIPSVPASVMVPKFCTVALVELRLKFDNTADPLVVTIRVDELFRLKLASVTLLPHTLTVPPLTLLKVTVILLPLMQTTSPVFTLRLLVDVVMLTVQPLLQSGLTGVLPPNTLAGFIAVTVGSEEPMLNAILVEVNATFSTMLELSGDVLTTYTCVNCDEIYRLVVNGVVIVADPLDIRLPPA